MRKVTNTMETVGHSISQSLALMTAMMNPTQFTFVTNTNTKMSGIIIILNKRKQMDFWNKHSVRKIRKHSGTVVIIVSLCYL